MGELPPWFSSKEKLRKQNRRSARQERGIARERGGRTTAGSGSSWRSRGDVKTDDETIQVKYTDKASFSIKVPEWLSICNDAHRDGNAAALIVEFSNYTDAMGRPVRVEVRPA